MQSDVKLGVVISLVVVAVAGAYYLRRDTSEPTIALTSGADQVNAPSSATQASNKTKSPQANSPSPRKAMKKSGRPNAKAPKKALPTGVANAKGKSSLTRPLPRGKRGVAQPPKKLLAGKTAGSRTIGAKKPASNQRPANGKNATKKSRSAAPVVKKKGDVAGTNGKKRTEPGAGKVDARKSLALTGRGRVDPSAKKQPAAAKKTAARRHGTPGRLKGLRAGDAKAKAAPTPKGRKIVKKSAAPTRKNISRKAAGLTHDPSVEVHRVQPGDTFSSLAASYYGTVRLVDFLIAANPSITNPDRLRVGDRVRIPTKPKDGVANPGVKPIKKTTPPTKKTTTAQSGRTYTVKPGDSFYAIAGRVLGDTQRWNELFQLNSNLVGGDPKSLQVGQVLALPSS